MRGPQGGPDARRPEVDPGRPSLTGRIDGESIAIARERVKSEFREKNSAKIIPFLLFTCSANLGRIPPALTPLAAGRDGVPVLGAVGGRNPRRPSGKDPFSTQGVLNVRTSLCSAALAAVVLACGFASPAFGQASGTAVAVIDVPYIFKNHVRFQQQIEDIKKDIDAYKDVVTQQQTQLRTESERLNQYKSGTREYKEVEENIARLRVEFQLDSAKRQKEFMEREAKVYFNVYREVEAAVADFAGRNRIGLVLRYSADDMDPSKRESIMQGINRMVIYQNRLNITDIILDTLNRGTPAAAPSTATPGVAPPIPRR